jgi:hypothetical protein
MKSRDLLRPPSSDHPPRADRVFATLPYQSFVPVGFNWMMYYRWMPDSDPYSGTIVGYGHVDEDPSAQTRSGWNYPATNDWIMTAAALYANGNGSGTAECCNAKILALEPIYYGLYYLGYPGWSVANDEGYLNYNTCSAVPSSWATVIGQLPAHPVRYAHSDLTVGLVRMFWWECKRPLANPCGVCAQRKWQQNEANRGAIVIQVDSLARFEEWYDKRFGFLHKDNPISVQQSLLKGE